MENYTRELLNTWRAEIAAELETAQKRAAGLRDDLAAAQEAHAIEQARIKSINIMLTAMNARAGNKRGLSGAIRSRAAVAMVLEKHAVVRGHILALESKEFHCADLQTALDQIDAQLAPPPEREVIEAEARADSHAGWDPIVLPAAGVAA
jgi:antitoxin component HigA of HigAB toxin-antitoxin module